MVDKKFININLPFYVGLWMEHIKLKLPNDLIFSLFIDKRDSCSKIGSN